MSLPLPPEIYSRTAESQNRAEIQRRLNRKLERGVDIELGNGEQLILISPNGTRFPVTVDDDGFLTTDGASPQGDGFVDYNNTISATTVLANTWHTLPNDAAGAFTNITFLPEGVTTILDTSTGALDFTDLSIGDALLIRNDFTVTPTINNALFEFRYSLGGGAGAYTLPKTPFRLNRGAGVADRIVQSADYIYIGDSNTQSNPVQLQVKCSAQFDVLNAGSAIQILRKD